MAKSKEQVGWGEVGVAALIIGALVLAGAGVEAVTA